MNKNNVAIDGRIDSNKPQLIYSNKGETYFMADISIFPPSTGIVVYNLIVMSKDDEQEFLKGGEICECYHDTSYTGTIDHGGDIAEYGRILVGANDVMYLVLSEDSTANELHYSITGDTISDDRVSKSGTLFNGPVFTEIENEIFRQSVGMSSYATVILDLFSIKEHDQIEPLEIYVSKYDDPDKRDLVMKVVPGEYNFNSQGLHRKYNMGRGSKYNIMRVTIPVLKQHERIIAVTKTGGAYYIAARGIVKKSLEELEHGN